MAKLLKEMATVTSAGEEPLLIRYERSWDDGTEMGGNFVCEVSAASWLADHIEVAADVWSAPDVEVEMPPDHLLVFARGGEHGEDTNVHIHNRRDPGAPRGGIYTMSGISIPTAKHIVAQLRALGPL